MNIKIFLFLTFFTIGVVGVYAQTNEYLPRIEFFSIPNSSINSEEISDIKIDSEGYVWIVSFKGLYRYDGEKFQKISANYNSYGSLIRFYEGNKGEKYVIDYWGAIYFIDNDSLYEYPQNAKLRKLYKGYGYSDIDYYDSSLSISFNASSYKIVNQDTVRSPLRENDIYFNGLGVQMREGRRPFIFGGNNYEKTAQRMFYLFDESWKVIDSVFVKSQNHNTPTSLVTLENNNYLFSDGLGNLFEFNEDGIIFSKAYPSQIINLFVDVNSNLWLSTRNEGVHFYQNGDFKSGDFQSILPNTTTIVTAQDYQNGIWLYSQNQGVGYISHPEVKFLSQKTNVKPLVETLEATEEGIYYSEENILKRIDRNDSITVIKSTFNSQIMRLYYDTLRSRLWVSTRGGLNYLNNKKDLSFIDLKASVQGSFPYFSSYWVDNSKSLVATCGYQYFIIEEDSISYISRKFDHKLKGVLIQGDSTFVNTGNGIYLENSGTLKYLGEKERLAKKSADQFLIFGGKIFVSIPSEGVFWLNKNNYNGIEFNNELIPSSQLVIENDSVMWALSNYGTYRIKFENYSFHIQAFNALPRMVLKKAEVWNNRMYVQSRNSGIGVLNLNKLKNGKLKFPKLLITKVEVAGVKHYKDYNINSIDYNENNVQISFKSLNYHGLDVQYRYRLNKDKWTQTITGFVNYVSLSPATYRFEVQSRFGIGEWSKSKVINFEITPPFWQKWWFIVICLVVLLFAVYQVVSFRFKLLSKEKSLTIGRLTAEQRALRAKMDPHFMFNIISSVQYLILRKENKKATIFLNKFSSLLRKTLEQTDGEMITIEDEINLLTEYVELEKMRMEDKFEYRLTISEHIKPKELIPTFLIQPLVENAIHHGLRVIKEKGILKLNFSTTESIIKVVVEDNGMGILKSKSQKSNRVSRTSYGIQTIKDRLRIYNHSAIKESIEIEDLEQLNSEQSGTRITLLIKRENYESANTR